jgi:adenylate cyclase
MPAGCRSISREVHDTMREANRLGAQDEVIQRALADERLRTSRLLARIRFVGISVAFAFDWLLPALFPEAARYQSSLRVFGVYWLVAATVYLAIMWSERMARLVGFDVALLDMPAAFALQLSTRAAYSDPAAAVLGVTYFAVLTLASAFALEPRRIILTASVGSLLGVTLLLVTGADHSLVVMSTLVMVGVAVGCRFLTARTIELVRLVADEQRRRLRLGRYVSPQVAARVESLADESAPGESRTVTVLFADLRGFTAISDALSSERVVAMLNDFHTRMVEAVFASAGTLDKYLGDGLMAYFGAPVPATDHAVQGVQCALAMQEALREMNAERAVRGERPLCMGVGVHSGPVVLGDVGAPGRREYTAIGDTVNVAARIEQLTKARSASVLVSDETRHLVGDAFAFQAVAPLSVKGKREPIRCWAPLPSPPRSAQPDVRSVGPVLVDHDLNGYTLVDFGKTYLEVTGHEDPFRVGRHELAMALLRRGVPGWHPITRGDGFQTTADLPGLLDRVTRALFLDAYTAAPRTFTAWTRAVTAEDFRPAILANPGFPALEPLPEHGEYTRHGPTGPAAPLHVVTYGRIIALTREAVLANDLLSFSRLTEMLGVAAAALESDVVYAILTGNPVMVDGQPLFSPDHQNLMPGAALSADSLAAATAALAAQAVDGTALHLVARYLLVGTALGPQARALAMATTPFDATPDAGTLAVIQDDRIPGTDWYVAADPRQRDTLVTAHLSTSPAPELLARDPWEIDGREYKGRDTFGAAVADWRGLVKTPGA